MNSLNKGLLVLSGLKLYKGRRTNLWANRKSGPRYFMFISS